MKTIHSILAVGLLCLLMFQGTGYLFTFFVLQRSVKQEIKQRIKAGVPQEELILFKISKKIEEGAHFQWVEGHEFRFHGRMYDVVRSEVQKGGVTWYYCVSDEQETSLFARLNTAVSDQMAQNSGQRGVLNKLMSMLQLSYLLNQDGLTDPQFYCHTVLPTEEKRLHGLVMNTPDPPPKPFA